jgi:hypothetical protein
MELGKCIYHGKHSDYLLLKHDRVMGGKGTSTGLQQLDRFVLEDDFLGLREGIFPRQFFFPGNVFLP